jgi:hypothetical protein
MDARTDCHPTSAGIIRDDETTESARRFGIARHRAIAPTAAAARWGRGGGSGTIAACARLLAAYARDFGSDSRALITKNLQGEMKYGNS